MIKEKLNILDNIIQAVSILNKLDQYSEQLPKTLSEYDCLLNGFYHFIEMTPVDKVNLKELYLNMQKLLIDRREVKLDMILYNEYKNNIEKLKQKENRGLLVSSIKTLNKKQNEKYSEYSNETLTEEILKKLDINNVEKKKRGRPKKVTNEPINNI